MSKVIKKKTLPFAKINNCFAIKTIVPYWMETIHPPLAGNKRNEIFENIVKDLKSKKKAHKDFPIDWFISELNFPIELPLQRFQLIGANHGVNDDLNIKFKEAFIRKAKITDRKYNVLAGIDSLKSYYFSYGIGFLKISTHLMFPNQAMKPEILYTCYFDVLEVLQELIDRDLLPPFNKNETFQKEFSKSFSKYSDNKPYKNWLLDSLNKENFNLENDLYNSSFIELFVEESGSKLASELKHLDDVLEYHEEDLLDAYQDDELDEQYDDLDIDKADLNIDDDEINEILNETQEEKKVEQSTDDLDDDYKNLAEEHNDMIDKQIEEENAIYEKDIDYFSVLEGKEKKYYEFNSKDKLLEFLSMKKNKHNMFENDMNILEHEQGLFSMSKNNTFDDGDILLNVNVLNLNGSYKENFNFSAYFYFKIVAFNCLKTSNLGLYANLFLLDKQSNVSSKSYTIFSNGFLKAKNILDILRFESSYETILNKNYRVFHDTKTENIERAISKNETVYDLIEQKIVGERQRQQKEFGEAVSIGLGIISILTVGLAAADITNFLGFANILSIKIKLPIIVFPVMIFIFLLYLVMRNKKKLEDK